MEAAKVTGKKNISSWCPSWYLNFCCAAILLLFTGENVFVPDGITGHCHEKSENALGDLSSDVSVSHKFIFYMTKSIFLNLLYVNLVPYNHACANGSSAVGDCLHTYLERDFSSIEAIIYAKKRGFAIYEYIFLKILK